MAYDFQVTYDSADPHAQADWWAETLGWQVEPSDEAFIREMIAKGFATEEETTTHHGALVWRTGAAIRHPESGRDGRPGGQRVLRRLTPTGPHASMTTSYDPAAA
jgi:hypothetical protein